MGGSVTPEEIVTTPTPEAPPSDPAPEAPAEAPPEVNDDKPAEA